MVAMVMAFAMGVTVYAADITITNGAAGSEYAAYRLLNATDGGEGKFAYTLNDKYAAALKEVTGKTEDNVKYNEKVSEVPENNSNVGYKFTGWTMKIRM